MMRCLSIRIIMNAETRLDTALGGVEEEKGPVCFGQT